jgi:hypothetical protein
VGSIPIISTKRKGRRVVCSAMFFDKTREGESRKEYDALIARKKAMRV